MPAFRRRRPPRWCVAAKPKAGPRVRFDALIPARSVVSGKGSG